MNRYSSSKTLGGDNIPESFFSSTELRTGLLDLANSLTNNKVENVRLDTSESFVMREDYYTGRFTISVSKDFEGLAGMLRLRSILSRLVHECLHILYTPKEYFSEIDNITNSYIQPIFATVLNFVEDTYVEYIAKVKHSKYHGDIVALRKYTATLIQKIEGNKLEQYFALVGCYFTTDEDKSHLCADKEVIERFKQAKELKSLLLQPNKTIYWRSLIAKKVLYPVLDWLREAQMMQMIVQLLVFSQLLKATPGEKKSEHRHVENLSIEREGVVRSKLRVVVVGKGDTSCFEPNDISEQEPVGDEVTAVLTAGSQTSPLQDVILINLSDEELQIANQDTGLFTEHEKELLQDSQEPADPSDYQATKLVTTIIKEQKAKEEHRENLQRLNRMGDFIDKKGLRIVLQDLTNWDQSDALQYKEYAEKERTSVRNLIKEFEALTQDDREYSRDSISGTKLNNKSLFKKTDEKLRKKLVNEDTFSPAILLLLDMSGSTSGYVQRGYKRTIVIFNEFCKACSIPLCIVGHSISGPENRMILVKTFEEEEANIGKLMSFGAYQNSRDDISMLWAAEYLLSQQNENRLMICLSDGVPMHNYMGLRFSGEVARQEINKVEDILKRKGITMFGLGVGVDLTRFYKKSIFVKDTSKLPQELVKIIKLQMRGY